MSVFETICIFLAGIAVGTINTVVGSGTLVTFPTPLAFGYPPVVATMAHRQHGATGRRHPAPTARSTTQTPAAPSAIGPPAFACPQMVRATISA
jgi:uncharacterized membrane protein YfcA